MAQLPPKHISGMLYGAGVMLTLQPQRKQTLLIYAWLFSFLFFLFPSIILILMFHLHHINILSPPASKNKK